MNTIIDLLGGAFIGGLVTFMIINLNMFSTRTQVSSDSELQLQQNSKTLAEILDHDLRKIGYKVSTGKIVTADSNKITFRGDIDRNGSIDVVTYTSSNTEVAKSTKNPKDIILYRIVNGDTSKGPSLGLTRLKFTYLDTNNQPTTTISNIKYIKSELWVESAEPIENPGKPGQNKYLFTYWEMKINPRNL